MEYRAVGNRCAIDIDRLLARLPCQCDRQSVQEVLRQKGLQIIRVDVVELARACVGRSQYRRLAMVDEAPNVVDCSSFTRWLYGQLGIWLPRLSVQQLNCGEKIDLSAIAAGDLIFTAGATNYFSTDAPDGVGHVGIATDNETIIHAANGRLGVVEACLSGFIAKNGFCGARRYIQCGHEVLTLEIPNNRRVETSDDIYWIVWRWLFMYDNGGKTGQ